jgi:hypothetical protein
MLTNDFSKAHGCCIHRFTPINPASSFATRRPERRKKQTTIALCRQVQRSAFGAQTTIICRVIGIAAYALDIDSVSLDQYATTDATIAAGGFDFLVHDFPSGWLLSNRYATLKNQGLE